MNLTTGEPMFDFEIDPQLKENAENTARTLSEGSMSGPIQIQNAPEGMMIVLSSEYDSLPEQGHFVAPLAFEGGEFIIFQV